MKKFLLFALVVGSLLLSGCVIEERPTRSERAISGADNGKPISDRVGRVVDTEAGVVCYIYEYYDTGGISCLPLSETQLDQ